MELLGLRTTIYPTDDLAASVAQFNELLGIKPYFDEPFYVGYNVGGYELGIDPNSDVADGVQSYWGVKDAHAAAEELRARGATTVAEVTDTGDGIKVGRFRLPDGSLFCIIENPHFAIGE